MQVDYISHMGDDLMVVNAAKVSFDKEQPFWTEDCERLIRYLARNKHWTPFGHPQIQIRITVPVFIAAQLKRHVVGVTEGGGDIAPINEVSRRYVKDDPEFFKPDNWRRAPPPGGAKQGSSPEPLSEATKHELDAILTRIHYQALADYKRMIDLNVAPEMARMILPQTMYTSWIWTGSLAFYARLAGLRLDGHAQYECRQVAQGIERVVGRLFPHCWRALMDSEFPAQNNPLPKRERVTLPTEGALTVTLPSLVPIPAAEA